MFSHLEIDNYAVGIPLIIIVVGVFVIGQIFFRRLFRKEKIESCHEVGGTMLQVLGTLWQVSNRLQQIVGHIFGKIGDELQS